MKQLILPAAWGLLASAAAASDLNVSVESGGQNAITVSPGAQVAYDVVAELSDAANEGLALVRFDLAFDGGDLPQASTPGGAPMSNFVSPVGLSNPAGYGGTVIGGDLIQVGGAQNTIKNSFAPQPTGAVITGVAQPGFPATVVSGTLAAPDQVGTYTLALSELGANVIVQGDTGDPFWRCEAAGAGTLTNLTITVEALSGSPSSVSLSGGGSHTLDLDAGAARAGQVYLMLGSTSGTSPGIPLGGGVVLPLNIPDGYFDFTLKKPNSAILSNSLNVLNGAGQEQATFTLPPGTDPSLAGIVVSHAYVMPLSLDFASNAVDVTLVP